MKICLKTAFPPPHKPRTYSVWRGKPKRLSICMALGSNRPTITDAAAYWRGDWWKTECGSSSSFPAAVRHIFNGTPIRTLRRTTFAWPHRRTVPWPGLIRDLQRRGLLDTTLVLWGGEFGARPEAQDGKGRDPPCSGFQHVDGWRRDQGGDRPSAQTDDIGLKAVHEPHHFRDIHTTLLHQLGLEQDALSYLHQGPRNA